jgi:hypothetical protein
LRETNDTVESIARRVGYAKAFALSVAFKRVRGTEGFDILIFPAQEHFPVFRHGPIKIAVNAQG